MKKFTKIATVAVMTMVTAGVFAGCGLKGGKDIGKEAALEAALADAGVRESDTTRLRVSSEIDDGRKVYEVRFDVEGTEYDYEISGRDGQILSARKRADWRRQHCGKRNILSWIIQDTQKGQHRTHFQCRKITASRPGVRRNPHIR